MQIAVVMHNYCQVLIPVANAALMELLVAELLAAGYEGFEETEDQLKAYIDEADFIEDDLRLLLGNHELTYSFSIIEKQNWNALWESNFEPVQVADFVGIRANFHPVFSGVKHEIIITPKMSFGTGHHATTFMVMQLMQELDFHGKTVFDFGTGTGILAILAEKLGAAAVLAVDNDDWSIENAAENISINSCKIIEIEKVSNAKSNRRFQVVIANINKNIILDNLSFLHASLTPGGQVLLSGLLVADEADIRMACSKLGWTHHKTIQHNGWIACWLCV